VDELMMWPQAPVMELTRLAVDGRLRQQPPADGPEQELTQPNGQFVSGMQNRGLFDKCRGVFANIRIATINCDPN
jgi:hypothetical protein